MGSVATGARQTATAPAADAKKKCKIVKKRVHGHIKKVRVCTKPKPKPKPTPTLPSKVTVTLDAAQSASAPVSATAGATLTAGGATLTIPAGAVAQTTTVTMTRVSKLGGLKGQIAGAVQLQPDGLQLHQPVTLTLDVPASNGLQAFTYTGGGTDFHLYPVTVAGGKATVNLVHFSGYGVGDDLPSPAVSRVRQFMAKVKPVVAVAKADSAYFAAAAVGVWELVLEMAALPTDDFVKLFPELQAVEKDLGEALKKLADDEHKKCVETHDIVQTARDVEYSLWIVFPLATLPGAGALVDSISYARKQVAKCESFELDFESTITTDFGNLGKDVSHVHVGSLKLNADNKWTNEAPLDPVSFSVHPGDCGAPAISTRPGDTFKAKLTASWDSHPPRLSLEVSPGAIIEILEWDCPPPIGHQRLETSNWSGGFVLLHGSPLTIDDWSFQGGSVFAKKTYALSKFITSESTTFVLRHTPE
jgi:hypothetical protein